MSNLIDSTAARFCVLNSTSDKLCDVCTANLTLWRFSLPTVKESNCKTKISQMKRQTDIANIKTILFRGKNLKFHFQMSAWQWKMSKCQFYSRSVKIPVRDVKMLIWQYKCQNISLAVEMSKFQFDNGNISLTVQMLNCRFDSVTVKILFW